MNWKSLFIFIKVFITIIPVNIAFATPQLIDKIVVIVNNDIILKSDVDSLMQLMKIDTHWQDDYRQHDSVLRREIIERLITDQIIVQIGQKKGIQITDEQLNWFITSFAKKSNMTISQMKSRLVCNGINYTAYCNQIRKEMLISEVSNTEIPHRIFIFPKEVDILVKQMEKQNNVAEKLNLSHIIISIPKNLTSSQILKIEKKARLIVELARKGENFNKLAIDYANDQIIMENIHPEWMDIKDLPSIFFQELRTAKQGDVIGPIRSKKGFHILKVNASYNQNKNIFSTEVNARHIFIKPSSIMSDDQARKKLDKIAKDIKSGKINFAKAAKEFSQDFISANHQGEIGWIAIDEYEPSLRNVLVRLNKNQMSPPVRSSLGWHLIELLGVRNIDKNDLIKKETAYRILFNQKFLEEAIIWMKEQRSNAYIKILNN